MKYDYTEVSVEELDFEPAEEVKPDVSIVGVVFIIVAIVFIVAVVAF